MDALNKIICFIIFYKSNRGILFIKEGVTKMATSSLTKHYKVKDNESADRLIKIIESAPKKGTEKGNDKHPSSLEEGRGLFKKVFAKVSQ